MFLKRALAIRKEKQYEGEDLYTRTAGLIALFGAPGEHSATEVFQAIVPLIFSWRRIKMWGKFLDQVPATTLDLSRLTASVKAAATLEPVERANFPLTHFVTVALQLPDPRGYVEVCRRENLNQIYRAFNPNTLEYIKGRYRGVVGVLASPEHTAQVMQSVKTIT